MAKIAISLSDSLLSEIDRVAVEQQVTRSELIRSSTQAYLEAKRFDETVARAREIYADIEAEDLALNTAYQPLVAEALPPSRWPDTPPTPR